MDKKQAQILIILSAIFTGGLVFFFLPSEIYVGNPTEFNAVATGLLTNLSLGAIAVAAILALPVLVPVDCFRKTYAVFTGGLFFSLWISGVFLVGDFGELDGSSFDLGLHQKTLLIHTFVFLAVSFCSWLAAWKWPGFVTTAISFVGIGLLVIGAFNFHLAGAVTDPSWEPVDPTELARFSSDKNLLIVLMDTFQSDVLPRLIEQDPSLANKLDGFRYYPDTLGVAPSTYLTMPAFHSGESYNNLMALSEYYDVGVKKGSFMVELAQNGYRIDLINPITRTCPEGANICEQQENMMLHAGEVIANETARLADLGLMRAAPGLTKSWVFRDNNGPFSGRRDDKQLTWTGTRVYHGNTVLQLMSERLWTDGSGPSAKLIHLFNSHAPYIFDDECNFIGTDNPEDRPHMTMQINCGLNRFIHLLEKLKDEGIYNDAMIILTADTGAGKVHVDDSLSSLYAQEHGIEAGEFGRLIGGANPVLAIKFPGEHGPMTSSGMQVQLTDVARTICETLGDCSETDGINLGVEQAISRQRPYNYYQWKHEYWQLNHIPGMVHYMVDGPLWLESSWTRKLSGNIPEVISTVTFSEQDNPEIYGFGWSHFEINKKGVAKRWSNARRAELYLPLPIGKESTLEFKVLMAPGLEDQQMTVKVNGEVVGTRDLEPRIQYVTMRVPAELASKPVSDVVLEFSRIKLPEPHQRRKVSVSFYQLKIYQ